MERRARFELRPAPLPRGDDGSTSARILFRRIRRRVQRFHQVAAQRRLAIQAEPLTVRLRPLLLRLFIVVGAIVAERNGAVLCTDSRPAR